MRDQLVGLRIDRCINGFCTIFLQNSLQIGQCNGCFLGIVAHVEVSCAVGFQDGIVQCVHVGILAGFAHQEGDLHVRFTGGQVIRAAHFVCGGSGFFTVCGNHSFQRCADRSFVQVQIGNQIYLVVVDVSVQNIIYQFFCIQLCTGYSRRQFDSLLANGKYQCLVGIFVAQLGIYNTDSILTIHTGNIHTGNCYIVIDGLGFKQICTEVQHCKCSEDQSHDNAADNQTGFATLTGICAGIITSDGLKTLFDFAEFFFLLIICHS